MKRIIGHMGRIGYVEEKDQKDLNDQKDIRDEMGQEKKETLTLGFLRNPYEWFEVVGKLKEMRLTRLEPGKFFNYMLMSMRDKDFYVLGAWEREKDQRDIRDEKDGRKEEDAGGTPAIPGRENRQDLQEGKEKARGREEAGGTPAIPGREMIGCAVVHGYRTALESFLYIDFVWSKPGTDAGEALHAFIEVIAEKNTFDTIKCGIRRGEKAIERKYGYERDQVVMVKRVNG